MTLSVNVLKTELKKFMVDTDPSFVGFPSTLIDSCDSFANAYDIYAKGASDISGDLLLSSNKTLFASTLKSMLVPPPGGNAILASSAFDSAFIGYWMGSIFDIKIIPIVPGTGGPFAQEITSIVTIVTPGVLQSLLLAEFGIISNDASTKVDSIANCFHTATLSAVQVLITGVSTSVPPIPTTLIGPIN
jgi:hypothetical protein